MEIPLLLNILKRRSPEDMVSRVKNDGLTKTLGWFDLIILGISAVIGSGIFVMIGEAACGTSEHVGAGPSLIVSILLAGLACVFPALCYAEFSSSIPVAGGAYTYTYASMGELMAWMTGWILILEYAISNITIAASWGGYLFQLLKGFENILPSWLVNPPLWLIHDYNTAVAKYQAMGLNPADEIPHLFGLPVSVNVPSIFIILIIASILIRGMKESAKTATVMVFIKLAVIFLFICVGAFYVKPSNWVPFAPNGFTGIILGAFVMFYSYLGFDALSTAAEETKEPQKNIPIGIIGTLATASFVYILVTLVFTGVVPASQYGSIDIHAPIAHITRMIHQDWVAGWISLGALAGLTSVLLVLQFAASRIVYSMARDNFLPKILRLRHPVFKTPHIIIWVLAAILVVISQFMDMSVAAQLCIFGTLTCFTLVCAGILIMRKTHPELERPFKVPFCPWIPLAGIFVCAYLFVKTIPQLSTSALLFPVWLIMGLYIYFIYGYPKNRQIEEKENMLIQRHRAKKEENANVR